MRRTPFAESINRGWKCELRQEILEYVAVRVVGIGYPHRPYPAVPFITIFNSFSFFTVYLHVDVHRLNELHSCALPCSNSDRR